MTIHLYLEKFEEIQSKLNEFNINPKLHNRDDITMNCGSLLLSLDKWLFYNKIYKTEFDIQLNRIHEICNNFFDELDDNLEDIILNM